MPYVQRNAQGAIFGKFANPQPGLAEEWLSDDAPELQPGPEQKIVELCGRIDKVTDAARYKVAGDPLRAVEYDRARLAAETYAAAGYQGEVPAMVAAWVTPERNAQQAADSILAEAAAYTTALELLRTTRLQAKEQIRQLMAAGNAGQAEAVATATIAAIEAAVLGIGNNT